MERFVIDTFARVVTFPGGEWQDSAFEFFGNEVPAMLAFQQRLANRRPDGVHALWLAVRTELISRGLIRGEAV